MKAKVFKKNCKRIDRALALAQDERKEIVSYPDYWEYYRDRERKYDAIDKILLFAKSEYRDVLGPTCVEANAKAKSKEEKKRVINAKHKVKEEILYINALLSMVSEISDAFYLKYLDPDGPTFKKLTRNCKMPEINFDKMPEVPEVLKASDFVSKCVRVDWLIKNFNYDANAKLYLKKRYKNSLKL